MVKDSHAPKNKANAPHKLPDEQRRAKGKSNTRGNRHYVISFKNKGDFFVPHVRFYNFLIHF